MSFTPGLSPIAASRRAWFVIHPKGLVVRTEAGTQLLPSDDDVAALGLDARSAHRLGELDGAQALATPFDGQVAAPLELLGLRELAATFGPELFAVAGRATHVVDWATTSRFCGRCGARTERVEDERCMKCPSCALMIYPRISPAIIVLVRRGEEALLARSARFPVPFYSTLAGFSEIGESLEETLAREVMEEAGIQVKSVRYFGSQPWPFPNSLMLGFEAEWAGGELRADGVELVDAKWFRADALPLVPPPLSIARRLIDAWVADVTARR